MLSRKKSYDFAFFLLSVKHLVFYSDVLWLGKWRVLHGDMGKKRRKMHLGNFGFFTLDGFFKKK